MTDERDPQRLRFADDSPSALVEALELSGRDLPSVGDLARIEANLGAALAGDDANGSPPERRRKRGSLRPVAAGATTSFQLFLAAAVAASSFGAGIWLYATTPKETPHAPALSPASSPPLKEVVPVEIQETVPQRSSAEPASNPKAPGIDAPGPIPKSLASTEPRSTGSTGSTEAPVGSAAFADPETTEVALLGRAQQSLATDPGAALALTSEHARSFPHGTLAQEREFIAILALDALGRHSEAVARAQRFRADYPSSAHLRRLERLLGTPADVLP